MKIIKFLSFLAVLHNVVSIKHTGSYTSTLAFTGRKTKMDVYFNMCLNWPPFYARAIASDMHAGHQHSLKTKVLDIEQHKITVELERTDGSDGYYATAVTVEWTIYMTQAASCKDLRDIMQTDGVYTIVDTYGEEYPVYCDMTTDGGGWTLVGSVHENDINGKCTTGDKWSSENPIARPNGDGNWENDNIFGLVEKTTEDDYKNKAYFQLNSSDIMIWHVPNNTSLESYKTEANYIYRTTNAFLGSYGGNLQQLFKRYPLKQSDPSSTYGPDSRVIFDIGTKEDLYNEFGNNMKNELNEGYIQFRTFNDGGNSFALCPGVKLKPGNRNAEHACIGAYRCFVDAVPVSSSCCGDLAAFAFTTTTDWATSTKLLQTSFLIFYR